MAEPAPLITITDPLHPAPVHDVRDPEPPPHWSWPLRGLTLALLLLLTVGIAGAKDLRDTQRLRQRAEHVSVVARLDASLPVRLSGANRLILPIAFRATDRADLLDLHGTGGWEPVGAQGAALLRGTDAVLELDHAIDCVTPVVAPVALQAKLRVPGIAQRDVVLALAPLGSTRALEEFVCGDVDARSAIRLVGTEVLRLNGRSTVTAQLANISTHALTVIRVSFPGFSFRPSQPLPLRLPGRKRGLLVEEELPTHSLVLDAVVTSCPTARAALDAASRSGFPDLLSFFLDGPDLTNVDLRVAGVETYLEAEWSSSCGG